MILENSVMMATSLMVMVVIIYDKLKLNGNVQLIILVSVILSVGMDLETLVKNVMILTKMIKMVVTNPE